MLTHIIHVDIVSYDFILVIIIMEVGEVVGIGIVKIAVDIVMIEDMEGEVGDMVEVDPQRSLMNPHLLLLLVVYQMVQCKEILIEYLII